MFLVPDRVAEDTVEQLRRAFDAMAADPDFRSDGRRLGLPIAVTSGVALDEDITQLYATPSGILLKAKALLRK
jgi:tripartite-type tricarboxylate transporter receptor subunit TctC